MSENSTETQSGGSKGSFRSNLSSQSAEFRPTSFQTAKSSNTGSVSASNASLNATSESFNPHAPSFMPSSVNSVSSPINPTPTSASSLKQTGTPFVPRARSTSRPNSSSVQTNGDPSGDDSASYPHYNPALLSSANASFPHGVATHTTGTVPQAKPPIFIPSSTQIDSPFSPYSMGNSQILNPVPGPGPVPLFYPSNPSLPRGNPSLPQSGMVYPGKTGVVHVPSTGLMKAGAAQPGAVSGARLVHPAHGHHAHAHSHVLSHAHAHPHSQPMAAYGLGTGIGEHQPHPLAHSNAYGAYPDGFGYGSDEDDEDEDVDEDDEDHDMDKTFAEQLAITSKANRSASLPSDQDAGSSSASRSTRGKLLDPNEFDELSHDEDDEDDEEDEDDDIEEESLTTLLGIHASKVESSLHLALEPRPQGAIATVHAPMPVTLCNVDRSEQVSRLRVLSLRHPPSASTSLTQGQTGPNGSSGNYNNHHGHTSTPSLPNSIAAHASIQSEVRLASSSSLSGSSASSATSTSATSALSLSLPANNNTIPSIISSASGLTSGTGSSGGLTATAGASTLGLSLGSHNSGTAAGATANTTGIPTTQATSSFHCIYSLRSSDAAAQSQSSLSLLKSHGFVIPDSQLPTSLLPMFHALTPLSTGSTSSHSHSHSHPSTQQTQPQGTTFASSSFKVLHTDRLSPHLVKRITGMRTQLSSTNINDSLRPWISLQSSFSAAGEALPAHPNLVPVREAFYTKDFPEKRSLCIVYDFYPGAATAYQVYLGGKPPSPEVCRIAPILRLGQNPREPNMTQPSTGPTFPISELRLWSITIQLVNAISAIHSRGLSAHRMIDVLGSNVILLPNGRVKLGGAAMPQLLCNSPAFGSPSALKLYQQYDWVVLARFLTSLAALRLLVPSQTNNSAAYYSILESTWVELRSKANSAGASQTSASASTSAPAMCRGFYSLEIISAIQMIYRFGSTPLDNITGTTSNGSSGLNGSNGLNGSGSLSGSTMSLNTGSGSSGVGGLHNLFNGPPTLFPCQTNSSSPSVLLVSRLMATYPLRFMSELSISYMQTDYYDSFLCREIHNGSLLKTILKICYVDHQRLKRLESIAAMAGVSLDSYGYPLSLSGANTALSGYDMGMSGLGVNSIGGGFSSLLALFTDSLFGQTHVDGSPLVDLSISVELLSKLEAGASEQALLISPSGDTIIVASYSDLSIALQKSFMELTEFRTLGKTEAKYGCHNGLLLSLAHAAMQQQDEQQGINFLGDTIPTSLPHYGQPTNSKNNLSTSSGGFKSTTSGNGTLHSISNVQSQSVSQTLPGYTSNSSSSSNLALNSTSNANTNPLDETSLANSVASPTRSLFAHAPAFIPNSLSTGKVKGGTGSSASVVCSNSTPSSSSLSSLSTTSISAPLFIPTDKK